MIKNLLLLLALILSNVILAQKETTKTPHPRYVKSEKLEEFKIFNENNTEVLGEDGCEIYDLKNSKPTLFDINEIQFVNDTLAFAVGDSGLVLKSVDGGLTWFNLTTTSWEPNYSLDFEDEMNGIVKSYFSIYKTADGGKTWTEQDVSTSGAGQLTFINDAIGFYNDGEELYRTTDRENWESIKTFDSYVRYVKIFNETEIIANTKTGIYHSLDNGETWNTLYENASAELRELEYISLDVWYMTTSYMSSIGGVAFIKTIDGGESWDTTKLDVLGTFPPRILFLDQDNGFVYGGDDTSGQGDYVVLKTEDGGETWAETNATTTNNRWDNDMVFINDSTGFIAGRFGAIQMTLDAGDNWETVTSSDTQFLFDVIYKDSTGLVGGESGAIFKTTDKGLTWDKKNTPTSLWIRDFSWPEESIYAISTIYAGNSDVMVSNDGGENWTSLNTFDDYLHAIHFYDNLNGFVAGSLGAYYITVDGGETWSKSTFEDSPNIRTVSFPSESVGYMAAETYLLKTIDAGQTWEPVNTTDFGEVYASFFLNEQVGFLGSNYGNIFKTTDGGISFDTLSVSSNPDIFSIHFFDEMRGYITTSFDVQYTVNGGETWSRISLSTDSELRDIYFHEDNRATVIGRGGAIFDLLVGEPMVELDVIGDTEWCIEDDVQTISIQDEFPYLSNYSLNWSLSGGGEIEQSENSITVEWTEVGTHAISVFPANSCGQGPTSTFEITVNSIPETPSIAFDGLSTLSVETEDSIQWYLNESPIEGANENSLLMDADGTYHVEIINDCGISKSEQFEFPIPLSVTEFSLKLYPNPASEYLEVETKEHLDNDLYLINLAGKRVTPKVIANNNKYILDVSSLPRGLYFVVFEGVSLKHQGKVILE